MWVIVSIASVMGTKVYGPYDSAEAAGADAGRLKGEPLLLTAPPFPLQPPLPRHDDFTSNVDAAGAHARWAAQDDRNPYADYDPE